MKFTDGYEDQKITFPMLMKDENKGVIIFANAAGVGMVLWSGQSNVVDAGGHHPLGAESVQLRGPSVLAHETGRKLDLLRQGHVMGTALLQFTTPTKEIRL